VIRLTSAIISSVWGWASHLLINTVLFPIFTLMFIPWRNTFVHNSHQSFFPHGVATSLLQQGGYLTKFWCKNRVNLVSISTFYNGNQLNGYRIDLP